MESQATPPAAPTNPSATMFQNTNIDPAEKCEFSNSARDMFKFAVNNYYSFTKEGENRIFEFSDTIDFFRSVVRPFIAEVRKNQSRSNDVETTGADGSGSVHRAVTPDHTLEGDPVNIIDIVPPEPSSLSATSLANRYTRSMLKCLAGYPLYDPKPFSELSKEYPRNGVNIGDVGFVRGDGSFDFLFNICPSKYMINPPDLPDCCSLETPHQSATKVRQPFPRNTGLFQKPITRTNLGEYICEGAGGAILELPEGAIEDEATNIRAFEKLAARHGVQWYKYTMTRGRKILNGSLYLITSSTKCAQWGTAVFDCSCAPEQGLRFERKKSLPFAKSNTKYYWKGSRAFTTKIFNPKQGDAPNQCVFLRGYKIMIRQDIFDNLCNDQPDPVKMTRQRAPSKTVTGGGLFSMTTKAKSDEAVLQANFNLSLIHPSDLVNAELLSQNPNAQVALTHDDVWCHLLRDNFPKLNYMTLIKIARSYTNTIDGYGCVYLQKISDSSNALEESNSPIQRTGTLTLQRPLAIADDDCISVPAKNPLILPDELVERILLLLDTNNVLTCRLVNREFNDITQSSIFLQYFLACNTAGVIDNPRSPQESGERLEALLKREEAWRMLKPVFWTTIKVNHRPSMVQIQCLTGGTFFLDDNNLKDLNYCHLPSSPQDNPQWNRITCCGPGEGLPEIFVNFVIAIYEHDLIVNVISSDIGNQVDMQRYSLDLVLLKFSTGEYHPLPRHPRIHVQRSREPRPRVTLSIVGDNLALIVHSRDDTFLDRLFIFDWKTGYKRLKHETNGNGYSNLIFVSPEILLVPNNILSHFEIWHLPPFHHNPEPPIQILNIQLPAVSRGYSLFYINCCGEPTPFLHSLPYFPPRPFFSSPENSIISVKLYLQKPGSFKSYTLIMPRRALLDTIQKWTSPLLRAQSDNSPMWLTNEVTVHKIADTDDGSVMLDVQSKMLDYPLVVNSPASHTSPDSGSSGSPTAASTTKYRITIVRWADWGPSISRWFQLKESYMQFSSSFGQKYAFLVPNSRDSSKARVCVTDFNLHNIRRNTDITARSREGMNRSVKDNNENVERGKEQDKEEELERLEHEGVFSEDVYMGLKCAVYHAPDEHDFGAVLVDEERLVGLKFDHDHDIESIKVFYFG